MPHLVVDRLETVEVDEEQRVFLLGVGQRVFDAGHHCLPAQGVGERVALQAPAQLSCVEVSSCTSVERV